MLSHAIVMPSSSHHSIAAQGSGFHQCEGRREQAHSDLRDDARSLMAAYWSLSQIAANP